MSEQIENSNEEELQKEENKKASKKIGIFLGALGILGAGYLAYWSLYGSKHEKTDNAYVNANQNTITSQITGNITEISVEDTKIIKKGTKVIQIENIDYKINLERAKNELAKSVRSVKSLEFVSNQNEELVSLKKVDFEKAYTDYVRDKQAYESGVLSKEQFDNTKHIFEQAKINLETAKTTLKNSKILSLSNSLKEHPEVAKAISNYKQAYIDFLRTDILATSDGVVAKKSVHIGQRVSPNQPLFVLVDLENEWVDANFKESQIANIKVGQKVQLYSDVNKKSYWGQVVGIGAGSGTSLSLLPAQNATGNWIKIVQRVPVRIALSKESIKENGTIPIGTSMNANVHLEDIVNTNDSQMQKNEIIYDEKEMNKNIDKIINENIKIGSK